MDLEILGRLRTPEGERLLERATTAHADQPADPVALSTKLRRDHPPDLVAAALTQARLRRAAERKFGADAAKMFFTSDGLEQATSREVASYRAARLASTVQPGAATLDLGCGLGGDLIALARAGLTVTGVEQDPLTAELARANLSALGLTDGSEYPGKVRVSTADATEVDRIGFEAVIADPARRGARGRVFDPDAYAPPWSFAQQLLADRTSTTCIKTAPIIEHERIEPGVTAEWVSLDGEVKEAAFWSGPGAASEHSPRRQATLLRSGDSPVSLCDADDPGEAEVTDLVPRESEDEPPRYLYEPDGAVIRAGLVTAVAPLIDGALLHPRIAYLVSERLVRTPFARAYRIEQVMSYGRSQQKQLKRRLVEAGVGRLTVKKRGVDVDPDEVRKRLVGTGPNDATLVLARVASGTLAMIAHPVGRV